ncbi:MAG: hypothetical protein RLO50_02870 [Azospirillaceae bacterium]
MPVRAMAELLDICAQADAVVDGASLRQHGSQTRKSLFEAGLLKQAGIADSVICQACFDDHWAEVEQAPDGEGLRYHCPTDGWTALDPEDAVTWRVDLDALVRHMAVLLGAPKFIEPRHLVDGHLWGLGDLRIGTGPRARRPKRTVFVVRRYNHPTVREAIHDALTAHGKAGSMLVLDLTSQEDARYPPAAWKVQPLMACRRTDTEDFVIDVGLISGFASHSIPRKGDHPIRVEDGGRTIFIGDVAFELRGDLQRRIVLHLIDAWLAGTESMSEAQLFAEIEYEGRWRVRDAFKKSTLWDRLITSSRGVVRLRIPELLEEQT